MFSAHSFLQCAFLCLFLAINISNNAVLANPYCPICGYGMMVTDPDGEVYIPTYGTFSCELLQTRSEEGFVPSSNCLALQMFSRRKCGCEPTEAPTKSPSTPAPTSFPSLSLAPSVTPSKTPTVAPSITKSSAPSVVASNVPSLAPSISTVPTSMPVTTPSQLPTETISMKPTVVPSAKPSQLPSMSISPTIGVRQHEVLEDLEIELEGIEEMSVEGITEFTKLYEKFVTDFIKIEYANEISDFETVVTITEYCEEDRRRKRNRQRQRQLRGLAKTCDVVFTQEFIFKTLTSTSIPDAFDLAEAPLDESIGRESLTIILQDTGEEMDIESLEDIDDVSDIDIPDDATIIYK